LDLTQPDEVRIFKISTSGISAAGLRFRDLLDIADVTGLDVMDLSPVLQGHKGTGTDRIKALAAFTWIVERVNEPSLTYDDVLDGRVEVTGNEQPDPTAQNPAT
jgi:hypothetical protein